MSTQPPLPALEREEIIIDGVRIDYTVMPDGVLVNHIRVIDESERGKGLGKKVIYKLMEEFDRPRAFFRPSIESAKRLTSQPPAAMLPDGRVLFVLGEPPEVQYPPVTLHHDDRDGYLYAMLVHKRIENSLIHYIRAKSRFWDYYEHQARLLEEAS